MLANTTLLFLGISVFFYCVAAGADFGAGILEIFIAHKNREAQEELISHAMGPVWEANHVWLILAIVILFTAFPNVYATMSVVFHIPLSLLLLGIILRGSSFTFRHYDVVEGSFRKYYSFVFRFSSVLTSLLLGMLSGALFLGRVNLDFNSGFKQVFISPWFNAFSFSVGIFTCGLFAFLAAVYLIGETTETSLRAIFIKRAKVLNLFTVVMGVFVFLSAEYDGLSLLKLFLQEPVSLIAMGFATLLLVPLWKTLAHRRVYLPRILAALQVGCVLMGWFGLAFPVMIRFSDASKSLTVANSVAPAETLSTLLIALVFGLLVILPSLLYLFSIFKRGDTLGETS